MPSPLVAGNWKMNTSVSEALNLALELVETLDSIPHVERVICPPFISLEPVSRVIQGSTIKLGAQNMHQQQQGAFTGEVSPAMLTNLCQYVILGHSERRLHFSESDEIINLKVKAAYEAELRPILCVGETLEQRQGGSAAEIVAGQVRSGLTGLHNAIGLTVAYEPVWAIGTGVAATPEVAAEIMGNAILQTLTELYGESAASQVPLLYGGSVNPDNIEGFIREKDIHGALVGGASLRADQFSEIVRITSEVKGSVF
ncbi:MAG: triose-phosphate isomerase [Dehalococcoidia bacterium]|nr:triose-phosphate isomerase [Dehalococcoidia bacterium]